MAQLDGALTVFVAVDGRPAGVLVLDDPLRPDAARTIRGLRQGGIERVVMVTGDRAEVADTVGAVIGVDAVLAERSPAEKLDAVTEERRRAPTIMVGDGINDAPALALADVGVAMGVRGATASSEAADIVLTVDRLDRVGEAVALARRTRRIALQSVIAGMSMSLVAMGAAAAGCCPPSGVRSSKRSSTSPSSSMPCGPSFLRGRPPRRGGRSPHSSLPGRAQGDPGRHRRRARRG